MTSLPTEHLIEGVPWFSQLDNRLNPSGSCNVTSVAMCLYYLGIRGDGSYPQLEDQLYARCNERGFSRHDPLGLEALAESYPGIKDDFKNRASLDDIRLSISLDRPVILHGHFTFFGHIIVALGYDEKGLTVNDPNGEYFRNGYDRTVSGERLHYSWKLISETCSPESIRNPKHIWMHSLYRM